MKINHDLAEQLIDTALNARLKSYSPYSHFKVGAALLAESGKVYTGCNIESAAFTPGICAERTAFAKAVSEGDTKFCAIAVVGADENGDINVPCPPCGVCRQVMMDFCSPDNFEILLLDKNHTITSYKLKELLPLGFGPKNLI